MTRSNEGRPILILPLFKAGEDGKQETLAQNNKHWVLNHQSIPNKELIPELLQEVQNDPPEDMEEANLWDLLAKHPNDIDLFIKIQKKALQIMNNDAQWGRQEV